MQYLTVLNSIKKQTWRAIEFTSPGLGEPKLKGFYLCTCSMDSNLSLDQKGLQEREKTDTLS